MTNNLTVLEDEEDDDAGAGVQAIDLKAAAQAVADEQDADVLLCNAGIDSPLDMRIRHMVRRRKKRPNVVFMLVTLGGDPDCAFRIAKCLQSQYEHFTLLVTGQCKSAGTLIALGAHELAFTEDGELGPLDIQLSKKDSLFLHSGLIITDSLRTLGQEAYRAFERAFIATQERSQGAITVKTAAEIATSMAVGLYTPLYAQLDPYHVGEAARAMQVAQNYGLRLLEESRNFDIGSLTHLVSHYASHSCVIDKDDALSVFYDVRDATEAETKLARALRYDAIMPRGAVPPRLEFLSKEIEIDQATVIAAQQIFAGPADTITPGDENGPTAADSWPEPPRPATQS